MTKETVTENRVRFTVWAVLAVVSVAGVGWGASQKWETVDNKANDALARVISLEGELKEIRSKLHTIELGQKEQQVQNQYIIGGLNEIILMNAKIILCFKGNVVEKLKNNYLSVT